MGQLTVEQIIKILVGVFVVAVVIAGIVFAFKDYIIPYFSGIGNFTG
jgi:hypothetical protein